MISRKPIVSCNLLIKYFCWDIKVEESYNRPSYKLSQLSSFQSGQELNDRHRKRNLHLVEGKDSKEGITILEEVQMIQNEKQHNRIQSEYEEENKEHILDNNEEEKVSKDQSEVP